MPKTFLADHRLVVSALKMLMKFGETQLAEELFAQIRPFNADLYTVMINGYNTHDQHEQCLKTFDKMTQANLRANISTYLAAINSSSSIGLPQLGEKIIDQIPLDYQQNTLIRNALVSMWGKTGQIQRAHDLFRSIEQPDIISYTDMVNAYGLNGFGREAIELFEKIPRQQRDAVSYVCVLNACSHSGLVNEARSIFDQIPLKTEQIGTVMMRSFVNLDS